MMAMAMALCCRRYRRTSAFSLVFALTADLVAVKAPWNWCLQNGHN